MNNKHLFTSESVSPGHPDKLSDQLSDAVLDYVFETDKNARVACEVLTKGKKNSAGSIVVAGEITCSNPLDFDQKLRDAICDIGYNSNELGFNGKECDIIRLINQQSPDIKMGVDRQDKKKQGAGDQGLMFGYASNETEVLMPAPIYYSHRLVEKQANILKEGNAKWLRPDAKSQVTIEYENGKPSRVHTIVIAIQHDKHLKEQFNGSEEEELEFVRSEITKHVVEHSIPASLIEEPYNLIVNGTGRFADPGGPYADAGVTGRKIIVDTYGGMGRHGGGAFSGKDPSKVDRSAAYASRWAAKHVVAAGLASKCEIQLAYVIGVAKPVSVRAESFGTSTLSDSELTAKVNTIFDFTPKSISNELNLLRPIYSSTAAGGHFGRTPGVEGEFPWEKLDETKISALRN